MDATTLARWQFATTTIYHFLIVPLSIGLRLRAILLARQGADGSAFAATAVGVLVMTQIVLVYQAWSYWVFRARVTGASAGDGYGGTGPRANRTIASAKDSAQETLGRPTP